MIPNPNVLSTEEMAKQGTCPYTYLIQHNYPNHKGPIGTSCDVCSNKDCEHHVEGEYAMARIGVGVKDV